MYIINIINIIITIACEIGSTYINISPYIIDCSTTVRRCIIVCKYRITYGNRSICKVINSSTISICSIITENRVRYIKVSTIVKNITITSSHSCEIRTLNSQITIVVNRTSIVCSSITNKCTIVYT
ncbi:hypothetical protein MBFIL_09010 [Methanobrevibacter filiformis]|uniref:Uncharacterized protein n=1 Tax=Methanobrevibacter filiformis TaxID=55758 RepID=A0A166C8E2_9EURY|nr:hypothetical protein MBFIL_09010 [Methanobrevibacter filiformis]